MASQFHLSPSTFLPNMNCKVSCPHLLFAVNPNCSSKQELPFLRAHQAMYAQNPSHLRIVIAQRLGKQLFVIRPDACKNAKIRGQKCKDQRVQALKTDCTLIRKCMKHNTLGIMMLAAPVSEGGECQVCVIHALKPGSISQVSVVHTCPAGSILHPPPAKR